MKKTAAILTTLLLLAISMAAADEATGSFAEARSAAAKLGKPVLVEFYAQW